MVNPSRNFERAVLAPLQLVILVSGIIFLVQAMWWWVGGAVISILYLDFVGWFLHPMQSAADLENEDETAAKIEMEMLPLEVKKMLVRCACNGVGGFLGVTTGLILWLGLGWSWYFGLALGCCSAGFTGAFLKLAFQTHSTER